MADKSSGDGDAVSLKACVRGHVQGVGFRVFIRSRAWRLGIRGYARNMPDGTVQIVATGDRAALDSLLQEVWRGPAGAHVTAVDSEWQPGELPALTSKFEVRL
jgi:acylphosphatase